MKKFVALFAVLLLTACTNISNMKITSIAFEHEGEIPSKYTCDGGNFNPPLAFEEIPEGTKSLALISDDPDAPAGTWVHWVVFNMDPTATTIDEDTKPKGTEGMTSFGETGYGGPCPPSGTHRYYFKLYALDTILNLNSDADKSALEEAMEGHIIEKAELMGKYARQ